MAKKRSRKPRISTVIFYSVLILVIAAFFFVMSGAMTRLTAYLETYQEAHINTQYQKVFHQLFDDPDWAALYERAGLQDTDFEGKQAYADYMRAKVGDQKLTCFIESDGTSGKKCPVYLGDEEIGVFYMKNTAKADPQRPWYYDIPFVETVVGSLKLQAWETTGLTLHYQRQNAVTVTTAADRIVLVNGTPLTDSHRIRYTETVAEGYLPEGLHGSRSQAFYLDGLLVEPQVTVTDLSGTPMQVIREAPGRYTEVIQQQLIPTDVLEFVTNAGKTYCRYMVKKAHRSSVQQYFDSTSETYRSIVNSELWMQDYASYRFGDAMVGEYYAYSDELFSARLTMSLFIERLNGTEKEHKVDTTFFLRKESDGSYKIYNMTNVDIQATKTSVRLQFFQEDVLVESRMVSATAHQLTLPQVDVPEGKVFAGWFLETTNSDGSSALSLVFAPQADNTVYLGDDSRLEPMTLYARFEDKGAN